MSTNAKEDPTRFYVGIDANVKPLEKPSMKATRKPAKGGLPNAVFIQAPVEDLPEELNGLANNIHINFPWGSLLQAVSTADVKILSALKRVAAPDGLLEILIGIDPVRDRSELERLGVPELTSSYLQTVLIPEYESQGFRLCSYGTLSAEEWRHIDTSWARRLQPNATRKVVRIVLDVN